LIKRAEQLEVKGLFEGYRAFADWHDDCVEFLENLTLTFRETVQTPLDVQKGLLWFRETFREPEKEHQEAE